jgi:peptidoglycan/xylan/chitin deacetylase (PgdA/CDA1 family)
MRAADAVQTGRAAGRARECGATIIVMYHYVRRIDRMRWPGIFPLTPAEFETQLDCLSRIGAIIHPDAIDEPARGTRPRIVLTFDDGTRDHYATVFPILRRRRLSGLFGVISGPASGEPMPSPHLIHWLTSQCDDASIWRALCGRFGEAALGDAGRATTLYARDTPLRARIKYALNFALAAAAAQDYLIDQVRALGADSHRLAREWFVTDREIVGMHEAGMAFAVHAHRHRPYAGPPAHYFESELRPCEQWLAALLGARPRHYIAAFGGSNAAGESTGGLAEILAAEGYSHGLLTTAGLAPAPPAAFLLPRLDCADLPPRKSIRELELLLAQAGVAT